MEFASAAFQFVLDRLVSFAQQGVDLLLGVDSELKKLERTVLRVEAIVDSVRSKRQHSFGRRAQQQLWLNDLQSLLHDAEDLLDEISLEMSKLSSNSANVDFTNRDQVRNLIFSRFKFNIPSEIVKIQHKLEDIAKEMDGSSIHEVVKSRQLQTSSLVDETYVIGRGEDKDKVLRLLLGEETEGQDISVTAVVGMAGIGKTTLAQLVYNDVNVVDKFALRIWISVSVEYTVERITKSIVECVSREMLELSDLDPIQRRLQEILKGKKFLIVLDGMWNENVNDWDIMCLPFKVAAQGSRILVTTRSMLVSRIVATTPAYHVATLSHEDCWELIKQRAFMSMNQDECKNLMEIGFEIAQKCKGLPLVARVLGSILRFKHDEMEWDAILKSKIWDLPESENQILATLKLSYDHLAPCLKRCFAYCSIFPTNFEFKKNDLVQLWVSEGFIQPKGIRRVEDIGKEYFDVLYFRSFFQSSQQDSHNPPKYIMHNLVHDLAQFVSNEVCLRVDNDISLLQPNFRNARHSSLLCEDIRPGTLEVFQKCGRLRTFTLLSASACQMGQIPYKFFVNLRYLRVLNLSFSNISELPDSIGALKHLRHLDVSRTNIDKLPESITNLNGMETLKLNNCPNFLQLPKNMKNLTKLRHVELDVKRQLNSMPLEFGKLTNLQTLSVFLVGKEKGRHIEELKDMRFLHGSICITNLENVDNRREAITAKLEQKSYLDELELQWNDFKDGIIEEQVLGHLQPHNRIKSLIITRYGGSMFPSWLGNPTFCRLEKIILQDCRYCMVFPSLDQLPMLKDLRIEQMHDLKNVEGEDRGSCSFPSLQSLTFCNMQNLQEWRSLKVGDMPKLSQLTIEDCPSLISLPSIHYLASLERLEICYCPRLQCLPIGGLPYSLKNLIIIECSILKERCRVHEGEDWSKIRSIPKVEIDYEEILVTQP